MIKKHLHPFLLLFLTLMVPRGPVWADVPTLVTLRAGAAPSVIRYDAGMVQATGAGTLTHTFLLRNSGPTPLTISRFQSSCDCTTATFVPMRILPVALAPGEQTAIGVTIVVNPFLTGPLEKSVAIYTTDPDSPLVTLTLDADLAPLVVVSPRMLAFGAVRTGRAHSLVLAATMPADLVPTGGQGGLKLLASDPDLQIVPLAVSLGSMPGTRHYSYRVTLAPTAALGPVRDLLHFARPTGPSAPTGLTLADSPGVPVTATVVGLATARPAAVAFGLVTQGHPATLTVTFSAEGRQVLAHPQAVAGNRLVRLRWAKATSHTRALKVTLAAGTPPGSFGSSVTVALPGGEHLRLPISAYVVTAEK